MKTTPAFATDAGPRCARCDGTIWGYSLERYGIAECASCGMFEGPLFLRARGQVLPDPKTAKEARAMHEDFRRLS